MTGAAGNAAHVPVLYAETLAGLAIKPDGTYLDGTFGRGGHARGILAQLGAHGRLLLIDKDPTAIAEAQATLCTDARVAVQQGSFAQLDAWEETASGLDGVLLDLGVSSPQLDEAERGFSFGKDGPLDMRMDPTRGESAAAWLAREEEGAIADVIWRYGEERMSRRIARAIVERRATQPLTRTAELAVLVAQVVPRGRDASHPATRTFQAIRIHINNELADVEQGLNAAHTRLKPGGRLAVISFHSLEDRIVKQFFSKHAKAPAGNRRSPVAPIFNPSLRLVGGAQKAGVAELEKNPRARSAVLRVAERVAVAA